MDPYLYLLVSIGLLLPLAWIVVTRPDLRHKIMRAGVIGGAAALLGEVWHLRDYWQPPTIVGTGIMSPEDFLFGFAIAGLGVSLYDTIWRKTHAPGARAHPFVFLGLFLAGLASLPLFATKLQYNSLIVSIVAFLLCAAVMIALRRDLFMPGIMTALLLTGIATCIYLVLFFWLAPHYWHRYWLLEGTRLGVTILDIPWTEIAWYFSWGLLAGVIPNFVRGTVKRGACPALDPERAEQVER